MSTDIDEDIEVADDEQYTDKKIKARILNAREMLNDAQHELYSARLVEPDVQYSELDALLAWGNLVRSYIRDLSILLNNNDLRQAEHYREKVVLGRVQLVPPDQHGYEFSKIAYEGIEEEDLIREFEGFKRGADIPQPEERVFRGLMSLVEAESIIEEHWSVTRNPREAGPNQERMTLTAQQPIPKYVYERALMKADEFLQQSGIGLEINAKDYMGGEEPGL